MFRQKAAVWRREKCEKHGWKKSAPTIHVALANAVVAPTRHAAARCVAACRAPKVAELAVRKERTMLEIQCGWQKWEVVPAQVGALVAAELQPRRRRNAGVCVL